MKAYADIRVVLSMSGKEAEVLFALVNSIRLSETEGLSKADKTLIELVQSLANALPGSEDILPHFGTYFKTYSLDEEERSYGMSGIRCKGDRENEETEAPFIHNGSFDDDDLDEDGEEL